MLLSKSRNMSNNDDGNYIYLISTTSKAKRNIYKLGKHKGTKKTLTKRYATSLRYSEIFYFKKVNNYSLIETEILKEMDTYRLNNCNGNKTEWICFPKCDLIDIIEKNIMEHDHEKIQSNANGMFLLENVIKYTMLGKSLDKRITVTTFDVTESNSIESNDEQIKKYNNLKKKYNDAKKQQATLEKGYKKLKEEKTKLIKALSH